MRVLFLGNSHTFFHDRPELFARFAEKTTGEKPDVTMLAYSGRSLDWHRREYFSLRFNLMHGGYDYCIIQQAAHPYPPIESTLSVGADIIDLCHRCGVKPVVYMTWAEKRFPENQQKMIDTCEKLASDNHALLAPIGRVWQQVQQKSTCIIGMGNTPVLTAIFSSHRCSANCCAARFRTASAGSDRIFPFRLLLIWIGRWCWRINPS